MRIAYLTTDEVNKHLALRLAAQWEVSVCPLEPRDPPPDGKFDAVRGVDPLDVMAFSPQNIGNKHGCLL